MKSRAWPFAPFEFRCCTGRPVLYCAPVKSLFKASVLAVILSGCVAGVGYRATVVAPAPVVVETAPPPPPPEPVYVEEQAPVVEVEYTLQPDLHARYQIDAAPITVLVDSEGVTRAAFVGAYSAPELWSALADLRATPT